MFVPTFGETPARSRAGARIAWISRSIAHATQVRPLPLRHRGPLGGDGPPQRSRPTARTRPPNKSVGNEQLPTAHDLELILNGPAAPAAPPANPAAILFDNGPLTTHPGGGFGGANASAVQTALGLTTFGFGHAISTGFRMADDFTVPAGGWNISTITFYAYQTGSTTTTTIDNVNLQIWNGVPGVGSVVFGDTTTNRLAGSSFSNIYRVTDTALTASNRPIMADVVTVNTTLPAGTYWLDWQTGGTLSSGPWAPPVSILGQTAKPGSNGLQFDPTAGTWNPSVDTGANAQQDLPFVIEGQVAGNPPNINVSPLSLNSTQLPNSQTQQTLTVANTGGADLTWSISEELSQPVARPVAPGSSRTKLRAPDPIKRTAEELRALVEAPTADLVQDGSFEAGTPNPFWTEFSTNYGTPLCDVVGCSNLGGGTGPLSGTWWAWFGGIARYEAGSMSQSVTIPSGGPAILTFWVEQTVCSGDPADYLEVNMDGAQLWVTTATDPACGRVGYRQIALDVSAYADDAAHTLEFNSEIFGAFDLTNFFVDDVVLGSGDGGVCSNLSDVPWLSEVPTNGTTAPRRIDPGPGHLRLERPGCGHLHGQSVHRQQRPRCRPRQRDRAGRGAGATDRDTADPHLQRRG